MGVAAVKNDRAILSPAIGALTVQRGRVVGFPESLQQLFVRDGLRIIFDLDHLGVASGSGTDLFVGGIFLRSASETAGNGFHARNQLEDRLGSLRRAELAEEGRGRRARMPPVAGSCLSQCEIGRLGQVASVSQRAGAR